jgi:hypothetical protein
MQSNRFPPMSRRKPIGVGLALAPRRVLPRKNGTPRAAVLHSIASLVLRCFQWLAAGGWEPRRGEKLKAQGNALGKIHAKIRALKGRNHILVSPLQGETIPSIRFSGRCPGLSNSAPSELTTTKPSNHWKQQEPCSATSASVLKRVESVHRLLSPDLCRRSPFLRHPPFTL